MRTALEHSLVVRFLVSPAAGYAAMFRGSLGTVLRSVVSPSKGSKEGQKVPNASLSAAHAAQLQLGPALRLLQKTHNLRVAPRFSPVDGSSPAAVSQINTRPAT